MPTQMLLCEHAEKLEAAKVLYELHLEWVALLPLIIYYKFQEINVHSTLADWTVWQVTVNDVSFACCGRDLNSTDFSSHDVSAVKLVIPLNNLQFPVVDHLTLLKYIFCL